MHKYKAVTLEEVTDDDEICGSLTMQDAVCYAIGLNNESITENNFFFSRKEFHRFSPYRWCVLRVSE
jgi:hypothetical protein